MLIWELTDFEKRFNTWNNTTRRHKTILSEKWLRQHGVLIILKTISLMEDSPPLKENSLRDHFIKMIKLLPPRLKWNISTKNIFKKEITDDDFISRP